MIGDINIEKQLDLLPIALTESPPPQKAEVLVAEVLVNVTVKNLENPVFTYRVPPEFSMSVQVGQPVRVSWGKQQNLTGFITALHTDYQGTHSLKDITELMDEKPLFDADYYAFIQWVAAYYATPVAQVMLCALPGGLLQKSKKMVFPGPRFAHADSRLGLKDTPQAHRLLGFFAPSREKDIDRISEQIEVHSPPAKIKATRKAKAAVKVYSSRYLAQQMHMPHTAFNRLLEKMKNLELLSVETRLEIPAHQKKRAAALTKAVAAQAISPPTLPSPAKGGGDFDSDYLGGNQLIVNSAQNESPPPFAGEGRVGGKYHSSVLPVKSTFTLSVHQQAVMDRIVAGDASFPYLVYGITGSGKTEVYISLTRWMLEQGRSVLIMVPEIALTSQIARRFISHFGTENIALWHSNLTDSEKALAWRQLQSGELRILIGARSAIWVPMKNPGLILIDEEHESAFKQDAPAPRYHAKTLAMELARRHNAKVVLGSATPELVSFYNAQQQNTLLHLPERFGGRPLAEVHIVDMKQERAQGHQRQLSRLLNEEVQKNWSAGEQSIILLNRRGFYTLIQCLDCDTIFQCPSCDVAVTYHRVKNKVCCHYCGYENAVPQYCAVCASTALTRSGAGTQRIEEELLKRFPEIRVLRLDSDILQRKGAYAEIFEAFSAGEADVLVGTQIVAKGLDVANVTLVGVVSADSAFSLPDYKSAERGFQLLTQVAGRAGRGEKPGRVIIQAVQTTHMVLNHAKKQDYEGFYAEEIVQRDMLGFPPFSQVIRLIISSENERLALQIIRAAALHLQEAINMQSFPLTLIGPAPCVLPRIQNRYRFHLLIKNFAGEAGHQLITNFYQRTLHEHRSEEGVHILLDIDAQSLL